MEDELLQFAQKAIIICDNKLLIIKKSSVDKNQALRYDLPGGRKKANETLDEHIKREVFEEVGLKVLPKDILNMWEFRIEEDGKMLTVVAVSRFCEIESGETRITEKEIDSFEWVDIDKNLLDLNFIPGVRTVVEKLLERRKV